MKRIVATSDLFVRFEVGKTYRASILHGGYSYYRVLSKTDRTVTMAESHVSEDDGDLVNGGVETYSIVMCNLYDESFDNVIGDQEAAVIWNYRGKIGYLYADQDI